MATVQIKFDTEYAAPCAACALQDKPGVKTGFSFDLGGIVCANGHEGDEVIGEELTTIPEPAKPVETPAAVPEAVAQGTKVTAMQAVPGGELEVTIRIREPHAMALRAEAEIQKQSPTDYLQDFLDAVLANGWGR